MTPPYQSMFTPKTSALPPALSNNPSKVRKQLQALSLKLAKMPDPDAGILGTKLKDGHPSLYEQYRDWLKDTAVYFENMLIRLGELDEKGDASLISSEALFVGNMGDSILRNMKNKGLPVDMPQAPSAAPPPSEGAAKPASPKPQAPPAASAPPPAAPAAPAPPEPTKAATGGDTLLWVAAGALVVGGAFLAMNKKRG